MAEVKSVGDRGGVPEFERIFQSLSEDATAAHERMQGYSFLLELLQLVDGDELNRRICEDVSQFCRCIQRDVVSSNEEIASLSLKILGLLLHRKAFVAKLPDDEACKFLLTLLALITTTSKKVCTMALWCLAVQDLETSVLALHLKMIISVVTHGIDNPLGSMGITYGAFQALMQLGRQLPGEMRDLSWTWAPPVYQKLLNSNTKMAELAENCLSGMGSVVLPPLPRLSEVVAADIKHRLLPKMDEMIKLDGRSACMAVQAWGWLVKLLGVKVSAENSLIKAMLMLLEAPFLSPSAQVRIASQVAWVSIIDAFVPSLGETGANGSPGTLAAPSTTMQLSHKRMKLLLVPLLKTMSWEKDIMVQRNCCCTWIYLLCRLGPSVNKRPIFDTAVVPMLETVFQLHPKDRDVSVWQACVDLLTDIIACKTLNETSSDGEMRTSRAAYQSPKTPVGITYAGVFSESHHKSIKWSSWNLDRLESLIKTVHLLWTCGLEQLDKVRIEDGPSTPPRDNFEAARECWTLLVKAVEAEGRNTLRPSSEHVTAVHLLLKFLYAVCINRPCEKILPSTWALVEILIDVLGPGVMASSFYRIHLQFAELVDFMEEKRGDCGPHADSSLPDMVTPIVYISAAWFKMVFQTASEGRMEVMWLQRVEKLVTSGRAGFDVMGNYHGFAWTLGHLAKGSHLHQGESPSIKKAFLGKGAKSETAMMQNWFFLLAVWRTVAEKLREQVERSNDVPPVGGCGRDSGYQVVLSILLFPLKCFLLHSPQEYQESRAKMEPRHGITEVIDASEAELLSIEGPWFKLFDSVLRISSLKSPQPNSFMGGYFSRVIKVLKSSLQEGGHQVIGGATRIDFDTTKLSNCCLRFLGDVVAHAMKHAEISNLAMLAISRKRRKVGYGASSVRVQYIAGMELEDANNLKDLLTVASRLLTLSYEKYNQQKRHDSIHEPVIRVLGALTSLMQHVTSQNDSVLLLQALAQPMTCWLTVGSEASESAPVGNSQGRYLPASILEGLAQAWDGLLLCLQNCRPCLVFDSNLLLAQASSLAPAFLHHHDGISNNTLAFWEASYGLRAVALKYPPALVKVFNKLKQKVDISLPGWTMRPVAATERHPDDGLVSSSHQPVTKVGRQLGERIQSMMNAVDKRAAKREDHKTGSDKSQEMNSGSLEQFTAHEVGLDQQVTHMNLLSRTESCNEDTAELKYPVNAVNDASLEQQDEFMPTPEGNAVIDALVNMECVSQLNFEEIFKSANPDQTAISPDLETDLCAPNVADSVADGQAVELPTMLEITDLLETCTTVAPEVHLNLGVKRLTSPDDKEDEPPSKVHKECDVVDKVTDMTKVIPALVTPPIAFNDVPSIPPKIPVGVERPQGGANAGLLQVSEAPIASKDSPAGSELPRRRKKLKFQDDSQEVEYVVIPQDQRKKAGPLTDRQKEVRSSQRTSGRVVKTYTAADFSQMVDDGDDDLTDSQAVDEATEAACKENIPYNLLRLNQETTSGEGTAGHSGIHEVAQRSGKDESNVSNECVKTVPLEEVDYIQLKERLKSLLQDDPSLTYRQIFHQEQYEYLPRLIQRRLGSQAIKLRKKVADLTENSNSGEPQVETVSEQPQEVLKPSQLGEMANPRESEKCPEEEDAEEHAPSSQLLRRKPELQGYCQRSVSMLAVNLRSSGKLRGGKHWRINSELGRVITARLGIKKIVARRQRVCSNLALKIKDKVPPTAVDDNVVTDHTDSCPKIWGSQMQRCNHEDINGKSLDQPAQLQKVSSTEMQEKSPLIVSMIACNEHNAELKAPQPMELPSEMQGNSPFQVRKLNRGLLAGTYIAAPRVADEVWAEDDNQACTSTRAANHNPRKCRAPKRFPSQEENLNANPSQSKSTARSKCKQGDRMTLATTNDVMSSWNPEAVQSACPLEINQSSPILVRVETEGPQFQPSCVAEEGNNDKRFLQNSEQQLNSCTVVAPEGNEDGKMSNIKENFQTPAATLAVGLEPGNEKCTSAERPGADGLQLRSQTEVEDNPQPSTARELAEDPGKEPINEVQILLERQDVQVCQVLAALLNSSKWKKMEVAEAALAQKLLYQLREAVHANGGPSMFVTPTHF